MNAAVSEGAPGSTSDAMPELRRAVVRTLRTGVTVSAYALLVAIVGYAVFHSTGLANGPEPANAANLGQAFTAPSSEGLVLVGLVLLAVTPLARVVISLGYFAKVGDRAFTGLTFFVLLVLVLSVAVGTFL